MIRPRTAHRLLTTVIGLLLAAGHALAQGAPAPTVTRTPWTWFGYLIIVVLLAMVMAVSLMPSKRSHQD